MKLTNPQLAALAKHMTEHFPWAGSVHLRQPYGFDTLTEVGNLDVDVLNDGEIIDAFEVDVLGGVVHYA